MNSLLAPRRRRCSGDGGRMFAVPFASTAPGQPHAPPPVCTPRPLVPRSRADLYAAAPLLYGTPTFDVCFYSCSRRKERSQTKSTTRSDPHSLPQCIAASGHVSHATLPNPSRARGESAQNPCKKHAAKAKLAANHTDRAAAFKTAPPAPRRRRARHSLLRANNCALQLVAWRARLASPRARWKCCNKLKPCTPASSSSRAPEASQCIVTAGI